MDHQQVIRIIFSSGREKEQLIDARLAELSQQGFTVRFDGMGQDPDWPYTAGTVRERVTVLMQALLEPDTDIVFYARGGYGASDLLPHLDWDHLRAAREKWLIGFSDASAFHAAFFTHLGWRGLHAPMPSSSLWRLNSEEDVDQLLALLRRERQSISLPIRASHTAPSAAIDGWLFGGCLSILTALIGTPYFPNDLTGAVLFWEDIDENPGRLIRLFNQWEQSGALRGVKAIVLGNFVKCDPRDPASTGDVFFHELARRTSIPLFKSDAFGHVSPNYPLRIGAPARLDRQSLTWHERRTSV